MINPTDFLTRIFDSFDKSARHDLRNSLAASPHVTKWMIAADYCLHDKDRPNNAFAFTVIPYDNYQSILQAEIRGALRKDFKQTRDLGEDATAFLAHPRRFHFGFVFPNAPAVFTDGQGTDPLRVARESVRLSVNDMIRHGRPKEKVKRIKALQQESQAKNFNVELLADLYVLSCLFCFVTLALARERPIEIVGWFSDRDSMTTWCDGVVWDIGQETLYGLAQHFAIQIPNDLPVIAAPTPNASSNAMWFDEFVRLPDYIAAILAAWNLKENLLPGDKSKYRILAEDVVADAKNMAVFKIRYDEGVECSRVVVRRSASQPLESATING